MRLRPSRSNSASDSAGCFSFNPVRWEEIEMTRGAEAAGVNVLFVQTRQDQLISIGVPRIQPELRLDLLAARRRWRQKPPIDEMTRMPCGGERVH